MRASRHLGRRCTRKIGIIVAHAGERVVGMVDVTMARSHARERGEKERLVKSCLTNSSTQDEVEARRQNRFLVANGG